MTPALQYKIRVEGPSKDSAMACARAIQDVFDDSTISYTRPLNLGAPESRGCAVILFAGAPRSKTKRKKA